MDDGSPIGYIVLIVLFLLIGAYFSAAETSLACASRIRMMSLADNGDKRAKRVLYILDHFDKALTTILIGSNIVNIGCASIATLMATKLWGLSAVTVTAILTTLAVFLLAEMLPKRFAKACNEKMALAFSGSLLFLMKVLAPVACVFAALSGCISKPFKKQAEEPTVTEDELYDIIETFANEGAIDGEKTELVQNALEFSDTVAEDILTPWNHVVKVSVTMTDAQILAVIKENIHSRLPVVDVHGEIIGMLQIRKYLKAHLAGTAPLMKVMDAVRFVNANTAIDDLLPAMSALKTQIAVVRDDDGRVLGVVSVEDILEELVGEIYDEDDPIEITATQGGCKP
ncbi:MAG: hemolysin family protein [Clostridia bacterium]